MKKLIPLLALTLLVTVVPAFAQDDADGGFDINNLFNSDSANPENQTAVAAKVDVLVDLRGWLTKAEAPPLQKAQEKPLTKIYDKEVKAMEKSFEKQFGVPLATVLAAQTPTRGRRGGGGGVRTNPEQQTEITRMQSQLVDKVIAGLRIDQQAALRKYQSDQLRTSRFKVFTQSMTAAGLPLTDQQKAQVESLYDRESRLRTLIIIEAKGQPHQARVTQLETQTTQRIVRLLNQTQKTALAEVMAKSRSRNTP
jgi:hypothetical protein